MISFTDTITDRIIEENKSSSIWLNIHKKCGGIFYRGVGKSGKGTGLGALGNGIYLTWEKEMANAFAAMGNGKAVTTYKVKKNLKIISKDDKKFVEIKADMGFSPWQWSDDPMFANILTHDIKELGYDGVISHSPADGLCIFDEKKINKI